MSKVFTKQADGDINFHLDDLLQSQHPNLVTVAGLANLFIAMARVTGAASILNDSVRRSPDALMRFSFDCYAINNGQCNIIAILINDALHYLDRNN